MPEEPDTPQPGDDTPDVPPTEPPPEPIRDPPPDDPRGPYIVATVVGMTVSATQAVL